MRAKIPKPKAEHKKLINSVEINDLDVIGTKNKAIIRGFMYQEDVLACNSFLESVPHSALRA